MCVDRGGARSERGIDLVVMNDQTRNRNRDYFVLECVGISDMFGSIGSPEYQYVNFVPPAHSQTMYFMMSPIIECCEYFEVGDCQCAP